MKRYLTDCCVFLTVCGVGGVLFLKAMSMAFVALGCA